MIDPDAIEATLPPATTGYPRGHGEGEPRLEPIGRGDGVSISLRAVESYEAEAPRPGQDEVGAGRDAADGLDVVE